MYINLAGVLVGSWQSVVPFSFVLEALFPDQGLNLRPLHWKHGVLTTGPPGKTPSHLNTMVSAPYLLPHLVFLFPLLSHTAHGAQIGNQNYVYSQSKNKISESNQPM